MYNSPSHPTLPILTTLCVCVCGFCIDVHCLGGSIRQVQAGHADQEAPLACDGPDTFEMETFQFLYTLPAHGFPKVSGFLTHLDVFKNHKILKKVKKALKQCFWTEVWQVGHASSAVYTQHMH